MKKSAILLYLVFTLVVGTLCGCIEDGFSTSPSDQPVFSTDTLDLGVIFTDEPSPTGRFKVFNPNKKSLSIKSIAISGENAGCFRLNVDGISGRSFSDVEIRPDDSLFVLVEATLPPTDSRKPLPVCAAIDFSTNGITSSVTLQAYGQNAVRLKGRTVTEDTVITSDLPCLIYDSLVVAPGATLTLEQGASLRFHDKASLIVRGTLISQGTPGNKVEMCGDRTGNLVGDLSFELMSRQWTGVFFTSTSSGNRLSHTDIRNTSQGIAVNGEGNTGNPQLYLLNCRLHNSGDLLLEAVHSSVRAIGCEFSEGGGGLIYLHGGNHTFSHCTFSNNYLFSGISGPAIGLSHLSDREQDDGSGLPYTEADFTNSIIYGLGSDIYPADLAGCSVSLRNCLLKSSGEDDDNFIGCLWDTDPLFYTIRNEYIFDYRLQPDSPAIGAADPSLTPVEALTDPYGHDRGPQPDLGAYVFVNPKE